MKTVEVISLLKRRCAEAGSLRAWAKAHGISPSYVSQVSRGKSPPSSKLCAALGLQRLPLAFQEYMPATVSEQQDAA